MTDYTLKFPDEATAADVLEPFIQTHAIDTIGVIYKPTGEESEPVAIKGWHVNVRGQDAPELEPWVVEVKTPARVWV